MPVNFSVRTRSTSLFSDVDGDGVADAGDVIRTTLTFHNTGTEALDVTVQDLLNGSTLVPGSIKIGPMAVDDASTISGNTPKTYTFAELLGNDIDPDGSNATMTITGVSGAVNGTVTIDTIGQTVTFTPNTGYTGAAQFNYSVADAQGMTNVAGFDGTVNVTISGQVWYVDPGYTGVNGASDGSYLKPFTSLAPLNDDGTAGVGRIGPADGTVGDDDVDGANDTIFVYDRGSNFVNGGITLEAGQKLFGDAHTFVVNGLSIGASSNQTTINSNSGTNTNYGVTLSTGNEIRGINIDGDNAGTTNLRDGGGTVGSLTITDSSITGQGQAVDIDQGGTLNVSLTSLSSASSSAEGVHLAGTGANLLTGSFTANAGTIQTSTGTGVLIGISGGGTASSGGDINFTYGGDITSPGGSLVEIQDRTGGTVDFNGALTDGTINAGQTGILIDGSAGTINFDGQTFVSAGAGVGNGVALTNNTATINFNATGTGFDITTTTGPAFTFTGGGTLNVTGSGNSINSSTGQLVNISGGSTTSGIQFQTIAGTGSVAGTAAVSINNLDGAGTFNGGNVTIAGTSTGDGLFIGGGSAANFTFGTITIGTGANTVAGDGIEINGAGNGTVSITSVDIDATAQSGVEITGSTNTVTISGGTIGAQNDAATEAVLISGGTGAVTVNASLTGTTANQNLILVDNHSTGTVAFGGTLSSTGGAGGIDLTNNSGTINFTGSQITLTTGANAAVNITNNAAAINFTGGSLDITTTGGAGLSANATGGSVTVTGSGNTVSTGTGTAVNIQGTDIGAGGVTFNTVNTNGAASGIILANTGTGAFTVVGTVGVIGSGGSILNSTGNGIDLTNTTGVSLTGVTVTGSGASGIRGTNVNGLSLTNVTSNTNGNAVDEGGVYLVNASGAIFVTNSTFSANADDNFSILNSTGSLNLTVTGSTFSNSYQGAFGDDGLILQANDTANITALITSSFFQNAEGDHFQFASNNSSSGSSHITFTNNQLSNNQSSAVVLGSGITISPGGGADLRVLVSGNTITDTISGYAINLNAIDTTASALIDATISNNIIGTNGVPDSGPEQSGAIQVRITGSGTMNALVDNNDIFDYGSGSAIDVSAAAGVLNGSNSIMNLTVTNNLVTGPDPTNSLRAFTVQAGASAGTHNNSIRVLVDNNIWDNNYSGGLTTDARYIAFSNGDVLSPGYAGAANDAAAFAAFMAAQNAPGNGTASASLGGAATFGNTPGGANPTLPATPTLPPPPMMLAPTPPVDDGKADHAGEMRPPTGDPEGDTDTGTGTGTGGTGGKPDHAGELPSDTRHPIIVDDGVVTQAELDYLVEAAIQRWIDAGASPEQVAAMRAANFSVADMTGVQLGMSDGSNIYIDNDGGRSGWFLDTTPNADEEYAGSGTRLTATGGEAAEGVDLLTVLMHELGHQAGLGDHYNIAARDDLMYGYAYEGERRLPADGQADGAVPGSIPHPVFQLGPIVVGTVPGDNAFTVQYDSTVNAVGEDRLVQHFNNSATIDYRNVVAGPITSESTNSEVLAVDALNLGNRVFIDANGNNIYDAGEGVAGVTLTLYGDTNNDGVYDAGDLYVGYNELGGGAGYQAGIDTPAAPGTGTALTVTTGADGLYSFNFLAPGDYIVVVGSANFTSGGALEGTTIIPGAADPNDNVDSDNNVQAFAGFAATRAIRLDYNSEPTAGTGNDTNDTLDMGFVPNEPPVANDDSVTVDEDSGANDLTAQLLSNDTDPEDDPRTITSATQGTHGTTSVVAGVLTYTPNGNYNGTDTFTYTIDDGNGNTDTATVNVTVTAVNDPVTGTVPATLTLNEDAGATAIVGMSISDVDATLAPAGVYDVTLSVTHGGLTLTTTTGLTFTTGDGSADSTMTFHGTLADINTALATAQYTANADYNGLPTISLQVTDTFGGIVATGTGAATSDSDNIAVTVTAINDAPVVIGDGTVDADPIIEDAPTGGQTVNDLFSAQYSDAADAQFSVGNPGGSSPGSFSGIAVVANGSSGATGQWQYFNSNTSTWVDIGARSTASALLIGSGTFVRFNPALDFIGTAPTLTVNLIDNSLGFGITFGQVVDISGVGATGGSTAYSTGTVVLSQEVAPADIAPLLDLDADDSITVGTGFDAAYTEGGAAAAISDTDVSITDADAGDMIEGATITITNAVAGDVLNVIGALPGSITIDGASTATNLILTGTGTQAEYEAAIEQITFSNTGDNPTAGGTNTSRTINVTVTDGDLPSNVAVTTISVADDNADAPSGTSATITAIEDTFRLIEPVDLGFSDVDGTLASVTISAVTGGSLYFDADGTAGGGAPVLVGSLPQTYTAQDLIDGKVSFLAAPNANGSGLGTITFAVTDDDGNTDASPNVLTVDVTAVNDSPVLTTGGPIAATEQTAVAILPAGSVVDVDLDARNGGNGDYAGASFSVNRNPATNPTEDVFTLVAGPSFTIDGSNLKAAGLIFGTISVDGSAGLIVINFTSLETAATSALVDAVMQAVRYTNTSETPPASIDLAVGFDDGSPGGGQGAGATNLDVNLVTVNITSVPDAPVVTLADATVSGTEDQDVLFSVAGGNGIVVSDLDNAFLTVNLSVASGILTLATTVGLTVTGDGTGSVSIGGAIADINAALDGLVYRGNLNFNGGDTLTVSAIDAGASFDTESIAITLAPDGTIDGTSGNDTLMGDNNPNQFRLQQGGDDDAFGLGAADGFYFGDTFDENDSVDGGGGVDVLILQGNYGAGLTFGNGLVSNIINVDAISLVPGNLVFYGDTANNFYDYNLIMLDSNVAAGGILKINGNFLRVGEDFTFDGSAETNGSFVTFAGQGVDTLIGGALGDTFIFGHDGRFGAGDTVNGGGGYDIFYLRGDYTIDFNAGGFVGALQNIESIGLISGSDLQFVTGGDGEFDYSITWNDSMLGAGLTLAVNGSRLTSEESMAFNGSAETNGHFRIFGGGGNDVLTGGAGNDLIFGGARGDTLTGGAGNDIFRYQSLADSNSTERDGIQDFNSGDLIDLLRIDANANTLGDDAFNFIGGAAFSNTAGELRFENISLGGPIWLIQGDVNGDGVSDLEIVLVISPADPITASDFIL